MLRTFPSSAGNSAAASVVVSAAGVSAAGVSVVVAVLPHAESIPATIVVESNNPSTFFFITSVPPFYMSVLLVLSKTALPS